MGFSSGRKKGLKTASRSDPNGSGRKPGGIVPKAVAHIPPELLDGVEGVGLLERGAPRGAGLGLRLDVVPEGPLPVQLVGPLCLGSALDRRCNLEIGSRRRSRNRCLNLRHVERGAAAAFQGFSGGRRENDRRRWADARL
jgi:hypothetical protein